MVTVGIKEFLAEGAAGIVRHGVDFRLREAGETFGQGRLSVFGALWIVEDV